MEITVNVQVDLSDRVFGLLETMGHPRQRVPLAVEADTAPVEAAAPSEAAAPVDFAAQVLDIMNVARQRLLGADYEERKGEDAVAKIYRSLNGAFRNIATELGYSKPTAIDKAEGINAFASRCALLAVKDGKVITPEVF